jgi:hypothetical protein
LEIERLKSGKNWKNVGIVSSYMRRWILSVER